MTGSSAVIDVALRCGKGTNGIAPGNPPVLAESGKAARNIVAGHAFDDNKTHPCDE